VRNGERRGIIGKSLKSLLKFKLVVAALDTRTGRGRQTVAAVMVVAHGTSVRAQGALSTAISYKTANTTEVTAGDTRLCRSGGGGGSGGEKLMHCI